MATISFMGRFRNYLLQMFGKYTPSPTEEEFESYRTVAEFGYEFNDAGVLLNIEDGSRFQFNHYNVKSRDQRRYEALGEAITDLVYERLRTDCGLYKHYIPTNANHDAEPCSFIFVSPGAFERHKLLLLVQGSGVVRAGQWARSAIINDGLDSGSQIPYIKRAKEEGYGVVVLNPNDNRVDGERWERERKRMRAAREYPQPEVENSDAKINLMTEEGGRAVPRTYHNIRGNETPDAHMAHVWKHCLNGCSVGKIFVVAHSTGGTTVMNLIQREPAIVNRLAAVAFTASIPSLSRKDKATVTWFKKNCVNWVTSPKPLDTKIPGERDGCVQLSAGSTSHVMTSCSAFESVFNYFSNKLEDPDYQL